MSATGILALVILAALVGAIVGHVIGTQRGRDAQWVDDFIERARKDRERRDSLGRYRRAEK